jgi:hypothetical protein
MTCFTSVALRDPRGLSKKPSQILLWSTMQSPCVLQRSHKLQTVMCGRVYTRRRRARDVRRAAERAERMRLEGAGNSG